MLLVGLSSGMDFGSAFVSALIAMVGGIILFGLVGLVFAAVTVALYNFAASRLGGIGIEYRGESTNFTDASSVCESPSEVESAKQTSR